jgi:hypothetical protein
MTAGGVGSRALLVSAPHDQLAGGRTGRTIHVDVTDVDADSQVRGGYARAALAVTQPPIDGLPMCSGEA